MSDAEARQSAVQSYDRNVIVVAGAGTGKTSLLIERLLTQLVDQELDMTEITAITFTKRAATELRTRLEASLARLVNLATHPDDNPPDPIPSNPPRTPESETPSNEQASASRATGAARSEPQASVGGSHAAARGRGPTSTADRVYATLATRISRTALLSRAERLLAQIERASIDSIHGYCAALLRRFPAQSGVDPDFAIDDGPLFDALREELWEKFLSGSHGPEGEPRDAWRAVLRGIDLGELREIGWRLASFELPAGRTELAPTHALLEPLIRAQLATHAGVRGDGTLGPESYLHVVDRVLQAFLSGGMEAFRVELRSARFQSARGSRGLLDGPPPTSKNAPEAERCARAAHRLLDRLERVDDELCGRALDLLSPFARQVFAESRRRNLLPFNALLLLTRNMLADYPDVRRRISRGLRLLLVDEFQDTDPLQYELVFFLAEDASGPPAARAFETRLAPGKLFIVGDPKQAIYRFRGADMASYHMAVAHVERSGGQRLALTRSFRAPPELLEPLDRLFPPLLNAPAGTDGAAYSGYDGLHSARPPLSCDGQPRVEVWTVGRDVGRSADRARRDEAAAIASWIARELRAERIAAAEIAILFRAFASVPLYTGALREHGIPYALETGRDLFDRPEGQQLLALLRALAHPDDAPAVLGVLRSALGGVRDAELAAFAASAQRARSTWSYLETEPDPARFPAIARTYALLRNLQSASLERPLDSLLFELAEETGLLALHAAASDGTQRLANLHARLDPLIELARRDSAHTIASILPWLEHSEHAFGPPVDRDEELTLLTIHGAKGLEFPIVFLPDLARSPAGGPRGEATTSVHWLREHKSLALRTAGPLSAGAIVREALEGHHESAENRRLFYVACTRASERLILVHGPRQRVAADAPVQHLAAWGYPSEGLANDAVLPGAPEVSHRLVETSSAAQRLPSRKGRADLSRSVGTARRIAARARAMARPPFRHPAGAGERTPARSDGSDVPSAPVAVGVGGAARGRQIGTVLHEVLERWDFRSRAVALRLLRAAVTRVCRNDGGEPAELERHSLAVLNSLLESELPAYLASVEVVGRELPLLFKDQDGTAWSGTIDLLYRDPDGRLVVADYKTDREPESGARERYRAQLEVYARGVAGAFPNAAPPALELLYLRSGERVRLQ